ncbi:origin recognition complex subunit 1 protein [Rutstroemia sp. NJR-2017a WRK4]|nr:origin recognition complex subunit 1 protein [Rutstroemia sp. NJR-2017a WRK4]
MPSEPILPPTHKARLRRAENARKLLAGGRAVRDESDADEVSDDDGDWEWIYEESTSADADAQSQAETKEDGGVASTRKRRHTNASAAKRIIGAKLGKFVCKIADCVLINNGTSNTDWVGVIWGFREDEDYEEGDIMKAQVWWFTSEKDIHSKLRKRADFLENELYITSDIDYIPVNSINGIATILSEAAFKSKFPTGKIPKKRKEYGKTFICRRGLHLKSVTYTDEFVWEDEYNKTEEDVSKLIKKIEDCIPSSKRRTSVLPRIKGGDEDADPDSESELSEVDEEILKTPRKKQKTSNVTTPRKPRTPSKLLTPSHKRIVVKKPLEFTPLGTRFLDSSANASPFQTARSRLHVSSVPDTLPCREEEFSSVYTHLAAAITEGTGSCIYISGTPGTGKTATVREVVAQLNASVLADELDPFIFVEINGMKVTDPHQSYSLLWEALRGDRVSPSHALDLLEREFNTPSPRREPCVVLMDELDQLVTKNQSVMYNFFNWPGLRHSKLIVLAVANTMDLPERTLSNKISSRLGLTRITFPGYTHDQLQTIITSRLTDVPAHLIHPDAIQFASRKVASVSGDARRALDICRRAVELAEAEAEALSIPNTPSKTPSREDKKGKGIVSIATIKKAINEATTSPLQHYLRALPLVTKIFLAALVLRLRRSGTGECLLGEVLDEAKRMTKLDTSGLVVGFLLAGSGNTNTKGGVLGKGARVAGIGEAAMELTEAGVIGVELRKAERMGKVRLGIGEEDVKVAFQHDPEIKGLGFTLN